jgi:hypothetical protein
MQNNNIDLYSFVIRGVKIKVCDLMKMLNIEQSQIGVEDVYNNFLYFKDRFHKTFSVEATGNIFENIDYTIIIIGEDIGYIINGEVEEFDDRTQEQDNELLNRLKKFGITGTLKTFIQVISKNNE